ncbi:hypothetical protein S245_056262 [Arachis hypogaea]
MTLSLRSSRTSITLAMRFFPLCTSTSTATDSYPDLLYDVLPDTTSNNPPPSLVFDQLHAAVSQPELLVRLLYSVRDRPYAALRSFRWVERQPGFKGSDLAFAVILEILAQNGLMTSAYWVMEKLLLTVRTEAVMDVLLHAFKITRCSNT